MENKKEIKEVREIAQKIKIIEKAGIEDDESGLEREVRESASDFSSERSSFFPVEVITPVLQRSNVSEAGQAAAQADNSPRQGEENFALSISYSSAPEITNESRYVPIEATINTGIQQNMPALQNRREQRFDASTELASIRGESTEKKYDELRDNPEERRSARKLPWEI